MHTHNLLINKCSQWHVIETIIECLPQGKFISAFDLIEETVDSGNGLRLVVTTKNKNLFREASLQGKEEADYLTALFSSIDVVTQEEVFVLATQNLLLLVLFVLVSHFFEHME